jgi:hypothetical protein
MRGARWRIHALTNHGTSLISFKEGKVAEGNAIRETESGTQMFDPASGSQTIVLKAPKLGWRIVCRHVNRKNVSKKIRGENPESQEEVQQSKLDQKMDSKQSRMA